MPSETTGVEIIVAGRVFVPATRTTIQQDLYLMKRFKDSGLDAITSDALAANYELSELTERIVGVAYESGVLFELLAGLLVEQGVKWTKEGAAANAEFFGNVDSAEDKDVLMGPIVTSVLSFFESAASASRRSQKSSASSLAATSAVSTSASEPTSVTEPASGASMTMASGTPSSESLPSTNPTSTSAS